MGKQSGRLPLERRETRHQPNGERHQNVGGTDATPNLRSQWIEERKEAIVAAFGLLRGRAPPPIFGVISGVQSVQISSVVAEKQN